MHPVSGMAHTGPTYSSLPIIMVRKGVLQVITERKLTKAYHTLIQQYLSKGQTSEASRLAVALQTVSKIPNANRRLAKILKEME